MLDQVVSCQSSVVSCRSNADQQRTTDHGPRTPRSGISLTEVLISMGILTLGLLGVAALFPVGGFYMQKAEISDRGSAIAQSVMSDIMARGILDPRAWYAMIPPNGAGVTSQLFPSDGKYSPAPTPPKRATYTRPFAHTLGEALLQPNASPASPSYDPTLIGKQFGAVFVIDPMAVAAMAFPTHTYAQLEWNGASAVFPATGYQVATDFYSSWGAWGALWPVRRLTLRGTTGWQMDIPTAEHFCRSSDDLATSFPDRDDRPAAQLWDTYDLEDDGGLDPIARQWTGDYSWLATVAPSTSAARNALGRGAPGFDYDVSVVVFYKRPLPTSAVSVFQDVTLAPGNARDVYLDTMGDGERAVRASIVSTGLNGGELLLDDLGDNPKRSAFADLKAGHWIMLCGPHPNSSTADPRFSLNWYQVVAIEQEESDLLTDPTTQRIVTVRGPKWAWEPQTGPSDLSNNLCIGIFRGAVAVHTKTLRMESPRSSGVSPMGSAGNPIYNPPPYGPDV